MAQELLNQLKEAGCKFDFRFPRFLIERFRDAIEEESCLGPTRS